MRARHWRADLPTRRRRPAIFSSLAELLDLDEAPERIEVYDNSHISGTNPVGAMIVAGPEGFIRAQYRKFNMRNEDLAPGDDYAMMREMLTRRFSRLAKEKGEVNGWAAPDLVLIDGGPGQLGAAYEVLDELGLSEIKIAAVAKGPTAMPAASASISRARGRFCWNLATRCFTASRSSGTRRTVCHRAPSRLSARRRSPPLRSTRCPASDRRASAPCSSISARPRR
jgi:excinuclease UvrABC nuclease subunit